LKNKIEEKLTKISEQARNAEKNSSEKFFDNYLFSRNAPNNSLEAELIDELVAAKNAFDAVPGFKFGEKKKAKKELNRSAEEVLKAHQEFLDRGEKYITKEGEVIE